MPAPSSQDRFTQALIDNGWNYESLPRPESPWGQRTVPEGTLVVAYSWNVVTPHGYEARTDPATNPRYVQEVRLFAEFDPNGRLASMSSWERNLRMRFGQSATQDIATLSEMLSRVEQYAPPRQLELLQAKLVDAEQRLEANQQEAALVLDQVAARLGVDPALLSQELGAIVNVKSTNARVASLEVDVAQFRGLLETVLAPQG